MRKLAVSIVHHSMGSDRQQLGRGPVNRLLALAFLLSFCAASGGASLDTLWQDNHSPLSAGTSVMGVLMNLSQQPEANTRVLLVPVRVLDFRGKDIAKLRRHGTFILNTLLDKPAAIAQTDSEGRFAFKAPPAGRYGVGVTAKPTGEFTSADVTLLGHDDSLVLFDLAAGKSVDLGRVSRPKAKN